MACDVYKLEHVGVSGRKIDVRINSGDSLSHIVIHSQVVSPCTETATEYPPVCVYVTLKSLFVLFDGSMFLILLMDLV